MDVAAGEGGEAEDLADVLLGGLVVVVACGFDDGDFQIWSYVAGDLGYADARLVLHHADRFAYAQRHGGFGLSQLFLSLDLRERERDWWGKVLLRRWI